MLLVPFPIVHSLPRMISVSCVSKACTAGSRSIVALRSVDLELMWGVAIAASRILPAHVVHDNPSAVGPRRQLLHAAIDAGIARGAPAAPPGMRPPLRASI